MMAVFRMGLSVVFIGLLDYVVFGIAIAVGVGHRIRVRLALRLVVRLRNLICSSAS